MKAWNRTSSLLELPRVVWLAGLCQILSSLEGHFLCIPHLGGGGGCRNSAQSWGFTTEAGRRAVARLEPTASFLDLLPADTGRHKETVYLPISVYLCECAIFLYFGVLLRWRRLFCFLFTEASNILIEELQLFIYSGFVLTSHTDIKAYMDYIPTLCLH